MSARHNRRKASIVQVGGFRPTNEPLATNFGLHAYGAPGEEWPTAGGRPLLFVCQLNLGGAPAVPPLLADIRLITFFMDLDARALGRENGGHWTLRAYSTVDGLVPLVRPATAPTLRKGFECRWEAVDDQPTDDESDEELENVARTKVGGYASTIQSEPWWDYEEHPARPAYALQINSEEKVALQFGDGGTVYLARGTAPGCESQWFLDWQCF